MSTRRARQHQQIVVSQKAMRHLMRYKSERHNVTYYYYNSRKISGPRWRAINRVQTVWDRVASELMNDYGFTREETEQAIKILEGENHAGQKKAEPLGLLQFVTPQFDPDWATKEDKHD